MSGCTVNPEATSVDETLARVREQVRPLEPERVPLSRALGRVLREPVTAPEDQPPFDRSAMDGCAVRLDDNSASFERVDRIRAGDWKPRELARGQAVQIATGAPLPGPDLRVVPKEDLLVEGDRIRVLRWPESRFIRFRGEDARQDQTLVEPGRRLTPGALALLAGVGCVEPLVTRRPRVLHLATGNEIVPPERVPGPGQIRDSNSTLVRAFLEGWPVELRSTRVPEDRDAARAALAEPASGEPGPDLLLISGGASVGAHDFTAPLLEELGFTLHVRRTTTRPGKPLIFATRDATPAFGLPGNPLAHFVCLNLYVRAAIEGLSGLAAPTGFLPGRLAEAFSARPNSRETLWPARLTLAGNGPRLTPLPWRSSGDLTSLAVANALVRIPPGTGELAAGAPVPFLSTLPELP